MNLQLKSEVWVSFSQGRGEWAPYQVAQHLAFLFIRMIIKCIQPLTLEFFFPLPQKRDIYILIESGFRFLNVTPLSTSGTALYFNVCVRKAKLPRDLDLRMKGLMMVLAPTSLWFTL